MDIRAFYRKTMSYDDRILHSGEIMWNAHKLESAEKMRQVLLETILTRSREEIATMSVQQFHDEFYSSEGDKHGERHIRNRVASEMNSAKSKTGTAFEKAIMDAAKESGVLIHGQVYVGVKTGNVYKKKRDAAGIESVKKIDGLVSNEKEPHSTKDGIVLSKKTTLKDRVSQDYWCAPFCRQLIVMTIKTPNPSELDSLKDHGVIVVYPHAPLTEHTWSYAEFVRRMKAFQQGL